MLSRFVLIFFTCTDQIVSFPTGETAIPVETSINAGETIPYGISMVNALDIPNYVVGSDVKVCIIDSGYSIDHEDLPDGEHVTGRVVKNGYKQPRNATDWEEDAEGHG